MAVRAGADGLRVASLKGHGHSLPEVALLKLLGEFTVAILVGRTSVLDELIDEDAGRGRGLTMRFQREWHEAHGVGQS